ncbi:MAG TPA: hypothetical protein VL181_07850 [Holophagaceae bacterium]|nr:hypothetical protein [Holophagaceae bacterium]
MADFSNPLPDPLEVARRRHGFSSQGDLASLERLVALAARQAGAADLSLEDEGGVWFRSAAGGSSGSWVEREFTLQGAGSKGRIRIPEGPGSDLLAKDIAALLMDLLSLRRLGAERRRNPRGPEGASFIPGVVHELRNFLFAMGACLDAFEIHFGSQGAEAEHALALRQNLARLRGFMEELAEYGNPGQLVFSLQPLEPVLVQVLNLAAPLAEARRVQITAKTPVIPVRERMDRPALEGALRRFLELAVLETVEGGSVALHAEIVDGVGRPWLELAIRSAPGRRRDLDPARLFEPFHYRDKDVSRLGPAIARRMIEAHGGQVVAAIRGDGLALRVMLPVWMEAP